MTDWRRGVLRPAATAADRGGKLVVKLGGSLLGRPAWPAAVGRLLADLAEPAVIVVGGGHLVDALRMFDAAAPRPAHTMHALAIDAMTLTARFAADALDLPLVRSPESVARRAILDAADWLREGDRLTSLPVGWQVTSDTIAAVVAAECGGRLLLVKSIPPPPLPTTDLKPLARAGWVDAHFPSAATPLVEILWAAPHDAAHGQP